MLQLWCDMFGKDLRVVAHLLQELLEPEHLVGDGIPEGRSGMELVDSGESLHFVATIT